MSDSDIIPRYYLCNKIIYTDIEIAQIGNKTVKQINDQYDSGHPVCIDDTPIVISKITEKQLMWIVGNKNKSFDEYIYCPIGVPINIDAYNELMAK